MITLIKKTISTGFMLLRDVLLGQHYLSLTTEQIQGVQAFLPAVKAMLPPGLTAFQRQRGIGMLGTQLYLPAVFSIEIRKTDAQIEADPLVIAGRVTAHLSNKLEVLGLTACQVSRFVDITSGTDKGRALDYLCQRLDINKAQSVIAIGDSCGPGGNDLPMVKDVWKGINVGEKESGFPAIQHYPGYTSGTIRFLETLSAEDLKGCKLIVVDNDGTISDPHPQNRDHCLIHPDIESWFLDTLKDYPDLQFAILTGRGGDIVDDALLHTTLQKCLDNGFQDRVHVMIFNGAAEIKWHHNGNVNKAVTQHYFVQATAL